MYQGIENIFQLAAALPSSKSDNYSPKGEILLKKEKDGEILQEFENLQTLQTLNRSEDLEESN